MLDTHSHKYVQPLLTLIARLCRRLGVSADALTLAGLACGVLAALLVLVGQPLAGVATLWFGPAGRRRRHARAPHAS